MIKEIKNIDSFLGAVRDKSIVKGFTPAFCNASLMAIAPNCVADKSFKLPPKLPIGVLTAEII